MSGHSKWNNIKNKKAEVDSKKAKVFSEIAKKIRAAVKESGNGDPNSNSALRLLLDKARSANMPSNKVQRAIDCGLGKGDTGPIKEVVYEAFGPGGVAMLIVATTDNFNRTSAELRNLLSKAGGSLAGPGSAMYMFTRSEDGGFVASMEMPIEDQEIKTQLQDLLDQLRANDDVEDVYPATKLEE